jgi:hypothetical protein
MFFTSVIKGKSLSAKVSQNVANCSISVLAESGQHVADVTTKAQRSKLLNLLIALEIKVDLL